MSCGGSGPSTTDSALADHTWPSCTRMFSFLWAPSFLPSRLWLSGSVICGSYFCFGWATTWCWLWRSTPLFRWAEQFRLPMTAAMSPPFWLRRCGLHSPRPTSWLSCRTTARRPPGRWSPSGRYWDRPHCREVMISFDLGTKPYLWRHGVLDDHDQRGYRLATLPTCLATRPFHSRNFTLTGESW